MTDTKVVENSGQFKDGHEKLGGRAKGTPNKQTRAIKDVINKLMECSTDDDLQDIYTELKKNNPSALLSFYGKLAPKKLELDGEVVVNPLLEKLNNYNVKNSDNIDHT